MAKYISNAEAITFDEFIQYGKDNGANIVNGMPYSFKYNGYPVSHESDQCYLILNGIDNIRFRPNDILVIHSKEGIYSYDKDFFESTYERV